MALTLVEAAKLQTGDVYKSAVIEMFARQSDILRVLPFEDIAGNALKYNREETLPGIGFRGVNEAYAESTGVLNPLIEPLVICGGDLDVDKFIVKTQGEGQRSTQEAMKIKSLASVWGYKFIHGDSVTTSKEFDGLQTRLTGNQLVAQGATSGGDVLTLAKLDELIDTVDNPTALIMNKAMRRGLTVAARTTAVGGNILHESDAFGRRITTYDDLPILIADENDNANPALAFTEAFPGGGTAAGTSIYCVNFSASMLSGIQNGLMDVNDLGELDTKPVFRTRVEWYAGVAVYHARAAARLWGIKAGTVAV